VISAGNDAGTAGADRDKCCGEIANVSPLKAEEPEEVRQPVPGQMPKLLARFRDKLLPIWKRHGIGPIGFWTTLVGESSNELTYILPWGRLSGA
jgi:hypothetical protein